MSKLSFVVAALLVPALSVSVATAAPKKKKKKPKPAQTEAVAPAPTPPPEPIFDTKPNTSALQRVESDVSSYSPKEAPPPTITKQPDEPAAKATLTSADVPASPPAATPAPAPVPAAAVDADVARPSTPKRDALGDGLSVAPLADYGTSKVYGLGVGGRVGYTLSRIYFGGTFNYQFGGSNGPLSYKFFYLGPEVGYNLAAGPVVFRPYFGGGVGSLQTTYRGTGFISAAGGGAGVTQDFRGQSQSAVLWPGVTILVPVTGELALGADVRMLFAPGQDAGTDTLANNGVLKFPGDAGVTKPTSTALVAGLTASYRF
jgi:hypothetical protein